tara:strand:+ start:150 stop:578 length:429 start_codon:yes stop_codon:yes gene_type:complete
MSSVFTRVLIGEIPGRIIWKDKECFAMLDIRPINQGHTLVIPINEIDHWTDLPSSTAAHCMEVGYIIGNAQVEIFKPQRIGLMIAGFEVPHTHLHIIPIDNMTHLDFKNAEQDCDEKELDLSAQKLRDYLIDQGHEQARVAI